MLGLDRLGNRTDGTGRPARPPTPREAVRGRRLLGPARHTSRSPDTSVAWPPHRASACRRAASGASAALLDAELIPQPARSSAGVSVQAAGIWALPQ